ncbi:MAG: methyl-accepting chemotaxis protein [Alphaproteobacteria bacterium]|nr:methyl-accepting chemotaxis protein [Alphaproteobacteria bacterium]
MLARLSFAKKLTISTFAFIACILALTYFYEESINSSIVFAEQEKRGNAYQKSLMPILTGLGEMQRLHSVNGDKTQVMTGIDRAFDHLLSAQKTLGESLQFTQNGLESRGRAHLMPETVKAKWDALKLTASQPFARPAEEAYQSLIADIRGMISHAGDTSNLILDPDLDSYYLMDVTLLALPQTIDRLTKIQAFLVSHQTLSQADAIEIAVLARMLKEADLDRIAADFDTTFKEDGHFYGISPTLKPSIEQPLEALKSNYERLIRALEQISASGDAALLPVAATALAEAQKTTNFLWEVSVKELDTLLDKRISDYRTRMYQVLGLCGLGVVLSIFFFMVVIRDITRPLQDIHRTMARLVKGDFDFIVPHAQRQDESGKMAAALEVMQMEMIEKEQLQKRQEEEKKRAEEEKKRELDKIAKTFETNVKHVVDIVASAATEMMAASQGVDHNLKQSMQQLLKLVKGVETVGAEVENVSSSTSQLSSAINEIASQVARASTITHQAVDQGSQADNTVKGLVNAAREIDEVLGVINDITEQINLLALNATIEAARAGEAGKGFAVVASEVKTLANETARATEEIRRKITSIQSASSETAQVISKITGTINEINQISTMIAAAVEEQGFATQEIAGNVSRASDDTRNMADNAASVSGSADQANSSVGEMRVASEELSKQAEHLRREVEGFLRQIRQENA